MHVMGSWHGGKGSGRRKTDARRFSDNWDAIYGDKNQKHKQGEDLTWEHYCTVEASLMGVGKGEECNWCGETE
jgi:hypothetical protein